MYSNKRRLLIEADAFRPHNLHIRLQYDTSLGGWRTVFNMSRRGLRTDDSELMCMCDAHELERVIDSTRERETGTWIAALNKSTNQLL